MNTPKLSSTLSGIISTLSPVRAGESAQDLQFSQLLGAKHQQFTAPSSRPQANTNTADRRNETASPAQHPAPSERAPAATEQNHTQRNSGAEPRQAAGSQPDAAPPSQASNDQPSQPAADNTAAEAGATAPVAANDSAAGPQTESTDNPAGSGPTASETIAAGELSDAALAQQAAEAGLLAAPAVPATPADTLPDAPAHASPTAHAGQPALQAQPSALAVATGAAAAPAAGPESIPTAAAVPASSVESGNTTEFKPGTPVLVRPGSEQPSGQPANAFAHLSAAASPAIAGIQLAPPASSHAITTPAVPAPGGTPDSAAAAATHTLSLPLVADTVDTAAARSLQDFTAMVEAARAATGSTMPATAGVPQAAPPAGGAIAGLMPAGLFSAMPGQAPTMAAGGITAPLNSPQWPTEFGRQFISIAQSTMGLGQVAELRLDPPELGPLRITINLNDNVAHAVFSSPHAAVRQTVEQALPQLQQMLEQAGISLGQADVSDQQQSEEQFSQARHSASNGGDASASAGSGQAETDAIRSRPADPRSLVDTFA